MVSPGRGVANRLLEACFSLLLAALALYGAVIIIEAIWVQLCIILAVAGLLGFVGWWLWQRFSSW